jgi:polysaccharide export outer membrane protein
MDTAIRGEATLPARKAEPSRFGKNLAMLFGVLLSFEPMPSIAQQGIALDANVENNATVSVTHPQPSMSIDVNAVPEGFENLKLAPGFLLQMDIYGIPEMSAKLRIDTLGNVDIPLIGAVHVEGSSVAQAQEGIQKALVDQEILKNPQVMLMVLQFSSRNISVMGQVQSPGRIQLLAPTPLGDVLALAGGETAAAGNEIEIQHRNANGESTVRHIRYAQGAPSTALQSILIEPGDTVVVQKAGVIYVLGAVNRPGGYLMLNGGSLNVVQALALAGGETLQADMRGVLIVRRKGSQFEQIKVPLKKIEKGTAIPIPLEVNDALFVPTSAWKSLVLNGSSVLSAAAAASIYAAASAP